MDKEFIAKMEKLARNNYGQAYDIIERAEEQLQAYISFPQERISERKSHQLGAIATMAEEIGKLGIALEQRVRLLYRAGKVVKK